MFVLAGYETFWRQLKQLRDEIGTEAFKTALSKSSNYGLITYALSVSKLNKAFSSNDYKSYNSFLLDTFNEIKSTIPEVDIFLDSGGYQISIGLIPLQIVPTYVKAYEEFLQLGFSSFLYRAFSLDVIPPDDKVTSKELLDIVLRTNIDGLYFDKPFEGLLRIFHFNARCVLQYFDKIFDQFYEPRGQTPPKLAVGGLVAFDRKQGKLVTIPYLVVVLYLIRKFNLTNLQFHVLGVSAWKDILALEVLKHLLRLQGITLNYTFDSSRLFKFTVRGKAIEVFDSSFNLVRFVYKTSTLHNVVTFNGQRVTTKEGLRLLLSNLIEQDIPASEFKLYYDESDPKSKPVAFIETLIMLLQTKAFVDYLKNLDRIFSECKNEQEILRKALRIAIGLTGNQTYRKFIHQLEILPSLLQKDSNQLFALLQEIFRGVNRLNYFCHSL